MTFDFGAGFDAALFRDHANSRLRAGLALEAMAPDVMPLAGDYLLNGEAADPARVRLAKSAAVMAPIALRAGGPTMIFIRRADHLRSHSGQVAFPGGKIDPGEQPVQAAHREAEEEIGLAASQVEPLGWLDPYLTGTNFRIAPLVAFVSGDFAPKIQPGEVADYFEVPLAIVFDPSRLEVHARVFEGRERKFFALSYEGHYIWGATAGILRTLTMRLCP